MEIKRIKNGKWEENCYVLSKSGQALVIDPGSEAEEIIGFLETNNLRVAAVINTHGHFDHIGAVSDVVDHSVCSFYLHSKDERLVKSANLYMSLFEGREKIRVPAVDFYFDKIDLPLVLEEFVVNVIHTPGHTEGSVCFIIDKNIFSGDTLLNGTVGRTDLPGANKEKLRISLIELVKLDPTFALYPGHGDATTLANEIANNKYLMQLIS